MDSATDGWAVGGNDINAASAGSSILHYSGGKWTQVNSPVSNILYSVAMVSASDGWIVGDTGTILHYSGSHWTKVSSPTSNSLYSVAMVSASDGWAVGNQGPILHYMGGKWVDNGPAS